MGPLDWINMLVAAIPDPSEVAERASAPNGVIYLLVGALFVIGIGAFFEWWYPGPAKRKEIQTLRDTQAQALTEKDKTIQRVIEERDRALALNEALHKSLSEQVYPTLTLATEALKEIGAWISSEHEGSWTGDERRGARPERKPPRGR